MWAAIIGIVLFIIGKFLFDKNNQASKIKSEGGMKNKYQHLISLILSDDERIEIIQETQDFITLGKSNNKENTLFILTQTFGLLTVQWEIDNKTIGKHRLEWDFEEYGDQEKMANEIDNSIQKFKTNNLSTLIDSDDNKKGKSNIKQETPQSNHFQAKKNIPNQNPLGDEINRAREALRNYSFNSRMNDSHSKLEKLQKNKSSEDNKTLTIRQKQSIRGYESPFGIALGDTNSQVSQIMSDINVSEKIKMGSDGEDATFFLTEGTNYSNFDVNMIGVLCKNEVVIELTHNVPVKHDISKECQQIIKALEKDYDCKIENLGWGMFKADITKDIELNVMEKDSDNNIVFGLKLSDDLPDLSSLTINTVQASAVIRGSFANMFAPTEKVKKITQQS
jgi:hypothetical protein